MKFAIQNPYDNTHVSLRASEVTRRAARALNNKKNIMLKVCSIAENIV